MSAGDVFFTEGTPVVWQDSGGTEAMTIGALAAGAAREGARHDFGTGAKPAGFRWSLRTQWTSAPVAGKQLQLFLGLWDDEATPGDSWGVLNGSDTSWTSAAGIAKRESLTYVGGPHAETAAVGPYVKGGYFWMPARYVSPFIYNDAAVALAATGTYVSLLRLTPLYAQVQAA